MQQPVDSSRAELGKSFKERSIQGSAALQAQLLHLQPRKQQQREAGKHQPLARKGHLFQIRRCSQQPCRQRSCTSQRLYLGSNCLFLPA